MEHAYNDGGYELPPTEIFFYDEDENQVATMSHSAMGHTSMTSSVSKGSLDSKYQDVLEPEMPVGPRQMDGKNKKFTFDGITPVSSAITDTRDVSETPQELDRDNVPYSSSYFNDDKGSEPLLEIRETIDEYDKWATKEEEEEESETQSSDDNMHHEESRIVSEISTSDIDVRTPIFSIDDGVAETNEDEETIVSGKVENLEAVIQAGGARINEEAIPPSGETEHEEESKHTSETDQDNAITESPIDEEDKDDETDDDQKVAEGDTITTNVIVQLSSKSEETEIIEINAMASKVKSSETIDHSISVIEEGEIIEKDEPAENEQVGAASVNVEVPSPDTKDAEAKDVDAVTHESEKSESGINEEEKVIVAPIVQSKEVDEVEAVNSIINNVILQSSNSKEETEIIDADTAATDVDEGHEQVEEISYDIVFNKCKVLMEEIKSHFIENVLSIQPLTPRPNTDEGLEDASTEIIEDTVQTGAADHTEQAQDESVDEIVSVKKTSTENSNAPESSSPIEASIEVTDGANQLVSPDGLNQLVSPDGLMKQAWLFEADNHEVEHINNEVIKTEQDEKQDLLESPSIIIFEDEVCQDKEVNVAATPTTPKANEETRGEEKSEQVETTGTDVDDDDDDEAELNDMDVLMINTRDLQLDHELFFTEEVPFDEEPMQPKSLLLSPAHRLAFVMRTFPEDQLDISQHDQYCANMPFNYHCDPFSATTLPSVGCTPDLSWLATVRRTRRSNNKKSRKVVVIRSTDMFDEQQDEGFHRHNSGAPSDELENRLLLTQENSMDEEYMDIPFCRMLNFWK